MSDPTTHDPLHVMALVHLAGDVAEDAAAQALLMYHRRAYAGVVHRTRQEAHMCRVQVEEAVMGMRGVDRVAVMAQAYKYIAARAALGRADAAHTLGHLTDKERDQVETEAGEQAGHMWDITFPHITTVVIEETTSQKEEEAS